MPTVNVARKLRLDLFQSHNTYTTVIGATVMSMGVGHHVAGVFGIEVENKSGVEGYTLRLTTQDGTVLNEVPVQKGSVAWTVNLQPGQYSLKEASQEQWVCAITVE